MQDNNKHSFFGKIKNIFGAKKDTTPEKTAQKKKATPAPAKKTDHANQAPQEIRTIPTPKFPVNNSDQHLAVVLQLIETRDWAKIISYLNSLKQHQMTSELYGYLSVAYNNSSDFVRALDILALIPEADRDYQWYYRTGYSYTLLALNNNDPETHTILKQRAEACLQHAIASSSDPAVTEHSEKMLGILNNVAISDQNNQQN